MTEKKRKGTDWRTKVLAGLTFVSSIAPTSIKAQSFSNDEDQSTPRTEQVVQTTQTSENIVSLPDESFNDFRIGNWTLDYLSGLASGTKTLGTRPITPIPNGIIRPFSSKDYTIQKIDDYKNGELGYQAGEHVTMYKADKEHKFNDVDAQEYVQNNPLAELSLFLHEIGHLNDFRNFGMGGIDNTPLNAVRFDHFTESKSIAIQYLVAADYYHKFKEQGITEFQYQNNKGGTVSMPVDHILDLAPGLREIVNKYGSNVDNKLTSYAITAAAQIYLQKFSNHYDRQSYNKYLTAYENIKTKNFSTRVQMAKDEDSHYQKAISSSLKQVYIGRFIDLSHCRDLLDTVEEKDAIDLINRFDDGTHRYISSASFLSINDYLNSLNLKDDADKINYLEEQTFAIGERQDNTDQNLKALLAASDQQNSKIVYFDGTTENLIKTQQIEETPKSVLTAKMRQDAFRALSKTLNISTNTQINQQKRTNDSTASVLYSKSDYTY